MFNPWFRWGNQTLNLDNRVKARASRDEIAGPRGDRLRIRLSAPVGAKANQRLLRYLADLCAVKRRQVSVISAPTPATSG